MSITSTEPADNSKVELAPLLEAAVKWYGVERPPFAMSRTSMRRTPPGCITEKTVQLLEDKVSPSVFKKAKLFLRTWTSQYAFWTLDLDGERLIVKSFPGGRNGGSHYRVWIGIKEGFQDQPIAFSIPGQEVRQATTRNGLNDDVSDEDIFLANLLRVSTSGLSGGTPRAKRHAKTEAEAKIEAVPKNSFNHDVDYVNGNTERKKTSNKYPSYQISKPPSQESLVGLNNQISSNTRSISKRSATLFGPRRRVVLSGPDPNRATPSAKRTTEILSPQNGIKDSSSKAKRGVVSAQHHSRVATSKRFLETLPLSDEDDVTPASKRRRKVFSAPDPSKGMASSRRRHEVFSVPRLQEVLSKRKDPDSIAPKPTLTTISSGNHGTRLATRPSEVTAGTSLDQLSANHDRGIVEDSSQNSSSKTQEPPAEQSASFTANSAPTPNNKTPRAPSQAAPVSERAIQKPVRRITRHTSSGKAKQTNQSTKELALVNASDIVAAEGLTLEATPAPLGHNILSPHKISNTSFLVTVPPTPDFKVLNLSSCISVSEISTSILKLFKLDDNIELIDMFRITFEWLPMDYKYRTMLVDPDAMSSNFYFILGRIDKATVWVTEEECLVGVEILLKS